MLYGRLDVFSPDGPIQTFALTNPNTTVGRSGGNVIALDNTTISRYHFSITLEDGLVYIRDMESVNGTFVDGIRLNADEPRQLLDGEEILIGNLRIIYHYIDDAPTVRLEPLDDTTQRVELALANFYIDLQGPPHAIAPGANVSAELSITNTTSQNERFVVEIIGVPESWVRIDRPTPLVEGGETSFVLINFKPLRIPSSTPGDYDVRLRVYPKSQPRDLLEGQFTLTILPYGGFGLALEEPEITTGERFRVILHNQGSGRLPLAIRAKDKHNALDFRLAQSQLVLEPGQRRMIEGEPLPRTRPLFGQLRTYSFDVVVQSQDHARYTTAIAGKLLARPLLPGWLPAALLALIATIIVVVGIGAALILRTPPPQPRIQDFNVNKTTLARGEVLEITWQAVDTDTVRISVNGTVVASGPDLTRYNVSTDDLSGEVLVQVDGYNGEWSDSGSTLVTIYEPMHVAHFQATPPQLVRYTIQALGLTWNVPGARYTRITGLDSFTALSIEAEGPAGDVSDIPGIATDPLILTLVAEDNFGNVLESNLTINVINPQCTPNQPATIKAGPAVGHQVVATVPAGMHVTVDARDPSGGWVRVIGLSGGLSGWVAVTEMTCDQTFEVRNLQVESNIPPAPTLSPTAPPTLTPLPTLTPTGTLNMTSPTPQFTPSG